MPLSTISASHTVTDTNRPLRAVIAWLAPQQRIALTDLRSKLLPLDLLPSAVIEELNERALDLTGVLALEEEGDDLLVITDVFAEVLAQWDVD